MNRAAAYLFALGSAVVALSGCMAAPATSDDTREAQEALDLGAASTSIDKAATVQSTAVPAASVKADLLAPTLAKSPDKTVSNGPVFTSRMAKDCAPYDPYTSALAEFTIACTGTIGPDSFTANQGILQRRFDRCLLKGPITLRDIDDLLKLQEPEYDIYHAVTADGSKAPTIRECFVEPWKEWTDKYFGPGSGNACPAWRQLAAEPEGIPNAENVARFGKLLPDEDQGHIIQVTPEAAIGVPPPKENFFYAVKFATGVADGAKCGTAEQCGNLCSNGLQGFYVDTRLVSLRLSTTGNIVRETKYEGLAIVGDPLWWLDPTCYSGASPYSAADYYHPMSFYRALPGARYAHRNRIGEKCSYYAEPYHMIGVLVGDCVDPTDLSTCTMSHCDPTPIATPGSGSGAGSGTPTP